MEPDPMPQDGANSANNPVRRRPAGPYLAVGLAAAVGLALMVDSALRSSATYDEVAYLRVAGHWWRTGDADRITRMGSPLTFWKLQHAPAFFALDRLGLGSMIDDPERHQARLLPIVRIASLWIWLLGLLSTAAWARSAAGPRSMAFSAWMFAVSPNLLAHGPLATMEIPLIACSAAVFGLFAFYLRGGSRRAFVASAVVCGLAFSCKYTAIVFPPILFLCDWLERLRRGDRWVASTARSGILLAAFLGLMAASNLVVTGFSTATPSERKGFHPRLAGHPAEKFLSAVAETPFPSDWVGFAIQARHQRSGGPSYLLGEIRSRGWWYYYFVALGVKVPIVVWGLVFARLALRRSSIDDRLILTTIAAFLAITAIGSTRNYGVRYLLPMAPMAIVWISGLMEGDRRFRSIGLGGLVILGSAVASIHPHELSYFNAVIGGPDAGRRILSDSNLDWGQGLRSLADLQRERPEYRELTLYYFGDTRPEFYGVSGVVHVINADRDQPGLPPAPEVRTRFVAVSTSLLSGPWGPPGYFRVFDGIRPVATLPDGTISIYLASDLARLASRPAPRDGKSHGPSLPLPRRSRIDRPEAQ